MTAPSISMEREKQYYPGHKRRRAGCIRWTEFMATTGSYNNALGRSFYHSSHFIDEELEIQKGW